VAPPERELRERRRRNEADSAGVAPFGGIRVTPDGKAYAYSFLRVLGELFVVEGVR
jgi:hypothetical protein